MANEDAEPFVLLKEEAEEFTTSFNNDVENCIALLDEKIKQLISDPDCLSSSCDEKRGPDAHTEFTKAKYNIFCHLKSYFNKIESSWHNEITKMKMNFLNNVELFLARTKLEVQLPTKSALAENSSKKYAGSKTGKAKQELYPFTSLKNVAKSVAKNVAMFSPIRRRDEVSSMETNEESQSDSASSENAEDFKASPVKKYARSSRDIEAFDEHLSFMNSSSSKASNRNARNISKPNFNVSSRSVSRKSIPSKVDIHNQETESDSITSESEAELKVQQTDVVRTPRKVNFVVREEDVDVHPVGNLSTSRRSRQAPQQQEMDELSDSHPTGNQSAKRRRSRLPPQQPIVKDLPDLQPSRNPSASRRRSKLPPQQPDIDDLSDDSSTEITKPVPRRQTMFSAPVVADDLPDLDPDPVPANVSRAKSRRKTLGSVLDATVEPSPKRLKMSGNRSVSRKDLDNTKSNLLESDGFADSGNYTSWTQLKGLQDKIPSQPGIYELKVWRAKKTAFIGYCDNLCKMLKIHKLGQKSGNKHLDKFLERNLDDVHVRFEAVSSPQEAKDESKTRIKQFEDQHKTTPAYN